jgi:hypothetical protein
VSGALRIDDLARPRLPWPLRAANALPGGLARRLARLDEESLCEAARRRTGGLDDFGDGSFREPLRVLLAALEGEARLSAVGRASTRQLLVQLLSNRLLVEETLKRHPQILEERIERPLVIAGLPRTGTTHLHNLVSQDESLRTLPYWESLEPLPLPGERPGPGGRDPRVARCERALRALDWAMPLFRRMHEMTAEGPHEEIQLLAIDFSTMLFEATYHVPSYRDWYKSHDQTGAYRYLRRVLQLLQFLRGGRRWALKSPQHLEQLGPLLAVFPDACVVQTHRDPLRITASLCTMIAYGRRMQAAAVDPAETGRYWSARVEDLLRGSIEGRSRVPEVRVFDVRFPEFMQDDVAMAERVFAFAGQPLGEEVAARLRRFVAANPRGKHGGIAYRLEDVGLDPAERRRALRFYQEHFGVADEEA